MEHEETNYVVENNTVKEQIDYVKEIKNLEGDWLKLDAGTHEIKILEEMTVPQPRVVIFGNIERTIFQTNVNVEYQGNKFKWSITRGSSRSVWGQLIKLATKLGGLKDKTVHVIVKIDPIKHYKDYTVVEANQ